jgi:hypothetical protein
MRALLVLFFVLQIPAVLAAHGCSLAKGDCNGRTSDALLCPVLAKTCGWANTQSTCPSDCSWETDSYGTVGCNLNHADSVTYDNAYNEITVAVYKYKQNITCPSTVFDCGAECETFKFSGGSSYCGPKVSIIKAKLEADAYQRAAIQEGYLYEAHARATCYGLNEASCKASDRECEYSTGYNNIGYCDPSSAYDLAMQANACPDTDFTARAAALNMTMLQVYQKTGVTPANNVVTSAACDNSANLLFFTVLAVSVSFAARF